MTPWKHFLKAALTARSADILPHEMSLGPADGAYG